MVEVKVGKFRRVDAKRIDSVKSIERLISLGSLRELVRQLPENTSWYIDTAIGTPLPPSLPLEDDVLLAEMLKALEADLRGECRVYGVCYEYRNSNENYIESESCDDRPSWNCLGGTTTFSKFLAKGDLDEMALIFGYDVCMHTPEKSKTPTMQAHAYERRDCEYGIFRFDRLKHHH